jgi:hypothetical protein
VSLENENKDCNVAKSGGLYLSRPAGRKYPNLLGEIASHDTIGAGRKLPFIENIYGFVRPQVDLDAHPDRERSLGGFRVGISLTISYNVFALTVIVTFFYWTGCS